GHKIDDGTARPRTGIVDHDIRRADLALNETEQTFDLVEVRGVAGIGTRAGLRTKRAELPDAACGERDAQTLAVEQARQRRAQALAGTDNQGCLVFWHLHRLFLVSS